MQDISTQPEMTDKSTTAASKTLPSLVSTATDSFDIDFSLLQGYQVVLFFYPQNGLPGVTQMAQDFAQHYSSFKQIKTCVFGVSLETLESNQEFKNQLNLPFQLIADTDSELAQWFGTLTERTIFGDPIKTLEQSTFLINSDGVIAHEWRNTEVRGHVKEVIETAHRLAEGLDPVTQQAGTELAQDEELKLELGEGQDQLASDLAEIFDIS